MPTYYEKSAAAVWSLLTNDRDARDPFSVRKGKGKAKAGVTTGKMLSQVRDKIMYSPLTINTIVFERLDTQFGKP